MTAEEFDAFAMLPENRQRLFEFIGGKVVEVVSTNYSSMIGATIAAMVVRFVDQHRLGYVTGAKGGYKILRERYIPKAAFVSKQTRAEPLGKAYDAAAPNLVVEVLTPSNDDTNISIKIAHYLEARTVVWVADPDKKHVKIYAPDKPVATIGIDGVLDGGDVLPGFTLAVREIFPE